MQKNGSRRGKGSQGKSRVIKRDQRFIRIRFLRIQRRFSFATFVQIWACYNINPMYSNRNCSLYVCVSWAILLSVLPISVLCLSFSFTGKIWYHISLAVSTGCLYVVALQSVPNPKETLWTVRPVKKVGWCQKKGRRRYTKNKGKIKIEAVLFPSK